MTDLVVIDDGTVIAVRLEPKTGRVIVEHAEDREWIFDLRLQTAGQLARAMLRVTQEGVDRATVVAGSSNGAATATTAPPHGHEE
jgi:hypothetical protein